MKFSAIAASAGTATTSLELTVFEPEPKVSVQTTLLLVPELSVPMLTLAPVSEQATVKEPAGGTTSGVQLPVVTTEPSSAKPLPVSTCSQTLVASARPLAASGAPAVGPATTVVCEESVPVTSRHMTLVAVPLLRFVAST